MTPVLEEAVLGTDLDCQNKNLNNIRSLLPVPAGLLDGLHPSLDDSRSVPASSITNIHVAEQAAIDQSKLNLNGAIPTAWFSIGVTDNYAARGDLVERVSRKGAASGYVALDANGRIAAANITTGAGAGTVSAVKLSLVPELVAGVSLIESSGVFNVSWSNTPDSSWFGVFGVGLGPGVLAPKFQTSQLPVAIVPDLDASKFTTGMFAVEQLPVAVGMGTGHSKGVVPDPGATGDPYEYLGRDMNWHLFNTNKNYQPTVPIPVIVATPTSDPTQPLGSIVTISCSLKGAVLFYRIAPSGTTSWQEAIPVGGTFSRSVVGGATVYAYATKAGYNASPVASFTVPLGVTIEEG